MRRKLDPFDLPARLSQNYARVDKILDRLESGAAADTGVDRVILEAVAEIRQNMALAQKALETGAQVRAARQFEQIVIDIIARQSPRVRQQLIGKLNEARNNFRQKEPEPAAQPARRPARQ